MIAEVGQRRLKLKRSPRVTLDFWVGTKNTKENYNFSTRQNKNNPIDLNNQYLGSSISQILIDGTQRIFLNIDKEILKYWFSYKISIFSKRVVISTWSIIISQTTLFSTPNSAAQSISSTPQKTWQQWMRVQVNRHLWRQFLDLGE